MAIERTPATPVEGLIEQDPEAISIAIENPESSNERVRVFNQVSEVRSVKELAEIISTQFGGEIDSVANPRKELAENDLEVSNSYYIYCRTGARSAQACQILKQKGIVNCYNLLGGIIEWKGEIIS